MSAMTIRELLTYFKSLPPETKFPVGLGTPFIINNVTDQIIFTPKFFTTAEEQEEVVDRLLGVEVRSNTGARSTVQQDNCYAYFGIDHNTVITPLNIVVLTLLRSMSRATRDIEISFLKEDPKIDIKTVIQVPHVWWDTLSKRHQQIVAMEYFTNQLMGGFRYKEGVKSISENDVIIANAFGNSEIDGVRISNAFGTKVRDEKD